MNFLGNMLANAFPIPKQHSIVASRPGVLTGLSAIPPGVCHPQLRACIMS